MSTIKISQTEVEQIYKKAMIKRSQREQDITKRKREELEKNFWKYLHARIENLLRGVMELYQNPNVSKQQIDVAQKEFSDFLDFINTNTLPEVIDELVLKESRRQFQEKLKGKN